MCFKPFLEMSIRSTETVSVLASFASNKDLHVSRSYVFSQSHSQSPRISQSHSDRSSQSHSNSRAVRNVLGLSYSAPLTGKVVTNEYPANENHHSPGRLNKNKAKKSGTGPGTVLYNTLVWEDGGSSVSIGYNEDNTVSESVLTTPTDSTEAPTKSDFDTTEQT